MKNAENPSKHPSRLPSRRRALAAAVVGAAALLAAPVRAQGMFDRLLQVLRDRVPIAIGGVDAQAPAAPEYVVTVLQQIINRNQNEIIHAQWMAKNRQAWVGTATLVIDIDSSGRLVDVRLACATGQGRSMAGKAMNAVRNAGPYGPPRLADGNRPGRVTIDETFVFDQAGRWMMESAIDAERQAMGNSG